MALVTLDYYRYTYYGEPVYDEDFPAMDAKAERLIVQITHGRAADFAALPAFQQEAVKQAVCAQIEYYALNGVDVSINGDTGGNGWTVGKVRVNGSGGTGKKQAASMVCAAAIAALEQTGLMNPAVYTADAPGPFLPGGWCE